MSNIRKHTTLKAVSLLCLVSYVNKKVLLVANFLKLTEPKSEPLFFRRSRRFRLLLRYRRPYVRRLSVGYVRCAKTVQDSRILCIELE